MRTFDLIFELALHRKADSSASERAGRTTREPPVPNGECPVNSQFCPHAPPPHTLYSAIHPRVACARALRSSRLPLRGVDAAAAGGRARLTLHTASEFLVRTHGPPHTHTHTIRVRACVNKQSLARACMICTVKEWESLDSELTIWLVCEPFCILQCPLHVRELTPGCLPSTENAAII